MVYSLLKELEGWIYPPKCLICGGAGTAAEDFLDLCLPCYRELPSIGTACPRCGMPLGASPTQVGMCGACLCKPPPISQACIPFAYRGVMADLIRRLKFGGDRVCGRTLGLLLADAVADRVAERPDVVVPVPLHRSRHVERGFNQAAIIAAPVAARLGLPLLSRGVERVRATGEQTGLTAALRRRNVRGAFRVQVPDDTRHVAIVDDVVTTGSTAESLCEAFLAAGAARVDVWAVARTVNRHSGMPGYPNFHWVV